MHRSQRRTAVQQFFFQVKLVERYPNELLHEQWRAKAFTNSLWEYVVVFETRIARHKCSDMAGQCYVVTTYGVLLYCPAIDELQFLNRMSTVDLSSGGAPNYYERIICSERLGASPHKNAILFSVVYTDVFWGMITCYLRSNCRPCDQLRVSKRSFVLQAKGPSYCFWPVVCSLVHRICELWPHSRFCLHLWMHVSGKKLLVWNSRYKACSFCWSISQFLKTTRARAVNSKPDVILGRQLRLFVRIAHCLSGWIKPKKLVKYLQYTFKPGIRQLVKYVKKGTTHVIVE